MYVDMLLGIMQQESITITLLKMHKTKDYEWKCKIATGREAKNEWVTEPTL